MSGRHGVDEVIEAGIGKLGIAAERARLAPGAWSFRDREVSVTVLHDAEDGSIRVSATLLRLPGPPARLLPVYRRLLEWNATTRSARCAALDDLLVLVSGRSTEGLDVGELVSIVTEVKQLAGEFAHRLRSEFAQLTEE